MDLLSGLLSKTRITGDHKSKQLPNIVDAIKRGKYRRICVMFGAGVSTGAGIPDFRSPETGLYHNLKRLNLPYPEAVFDIDFFRSNPRPFYELAEELYPGKFSPTLAHYFVRLLQDKGILLRCFTQNIDTLERRAGVDPDRIIEAHGSYAGNHCIDCHREADEKYVRSCVFSKSIPRCNFCEGLVKPDIVFFGEGLPDKFFKGMQFDIPRCDLALVMGTSLTVHPFASLPEYVTCPRILINQDAVGDIGSRKSDVVMLMDCDAGIKELCDSLGWTSELMSLAKRHDGASHDPEAEVEKATEHVETALKMSDERPAETVSSLSKLGIPTREK